MRRPARNPESGFALLLIFAMAAIVAVTLYMEVPRVAFEAQRDKEQLLIDRGQEYSRAIALFVRKYNRFPASMEELENTNRERYLRRRFVDPMTGKADWRILHAGPGGVITDSVTLSAKPQDGISTPSNFTQLQMFGAGQTPDAEGVNLAARRRPSDSAGAPGDPSNPSSNSSSDSGNSGSGNSGYNGPVMVLPDGRIVPANSSGTAPPPPQPGAQQTGAQTSSPLPGAPGTPGGPVLPSGVAIQQNNQNAQNTPPLPPGVGGPPNSAASLINQILTTPRPGGLNGLPGGQGVNAQGQPLTAAPTSTGASNAQQQVIGAGLAGVASKREQEGIKTFNDRTKYNEWEFVYDVTKDPARGRGGAVGATGGAAGQGRGGPTPGASPTAPGFGMSSGPGR